MSKLELSLQDNIKVNVKTGEIGVFLLPEQAETCIFTLTRLYPHTSIMHVFRLDFPISLTSTISHEAILDPRKTQIFICNKKKRIFLTIMLWKQTKRKKEKKKQ